MTPLPSIFSRVGGRQGRQAVPAPQDARDGHRQDLRQVVRRPQEARHPAREPLPEVVEQHRGEQQADERRDDHHRDDHRDGVAERHPEGLVLQEAGVVVEPRPARLAEAGPLRHRVVEVHEERDDDHTEQPDGTRDQVEPVDLPGAVAVVAPAPRRAAGRPRRAGRCRRHRISCLLVGRRARSPGSSCAAAAGGAVTAAPPARVTRWLRRRRRTRRRSGTAPRQATCSG